MAVIWTEEQRKVIEVRDQDVLVSAAAGSGKTAVLVERILSRITDPVNPTDIDRLLVVTFTNAAAAEMRERIRDALESRALAEPDNAHLQRQLVLVHHASITTIHSFCLQVLRSHFHAIGLDPGFRIADEGECRLLEQDTVQEVLDEAYERREPRFHAFLECLATGRSDDLVEELILQLYHFSLGHPWPSRWLDACCAAYGPEEDGGQEPNWDAQPWIRLLIQDVSRLLSDLGEELAEAERICEEADGPHPYRKTLESDRESLEGLAAARDYASMAEAFRQFGGFARLSPVRDKTVSEEKKQQVQEIRNRAKKEIGNIRNRYFYADPGQLWEEFTQSGHIVRMLAELTKAFAQKFARRKAERNLLDFSDLEHLALDILLEGEGDEAVPSPAAAEYAEVFDEIMVDEYQDSNLVQELILNSVSGGGRGLHNRFMVGDVKQSIYRFRLARPELFMEKYKSYAGPGKQGACRIDLHRNFRSRQEVLFGVNYVFRQIMTEGLGGIEYDDAAALYPGAWFAEGADPEFLPVEVLLLDREGEPEKDEDGRENVEDAPGGRAAKQEEEARFVGNRILEIVGREKVWDKELGAYRTASWRDVVILLRTVSGWAEVFQEVLQDMGIPCFTGSQKGYFSAAEVRVVLSYLQILDNPVQDIPLAAVLRSAIGRFSDEELALIRARTQGFRFYDCCMEFLEGSCGDESPREEQIRGKLRAFFSAYERLRAKSAYTPVHLLLWELLDATGYGAYVSALPAGAQRRANLDMLVEKAIAYESSSYHGLYHFVRYIESLRKYEVDYGEASVSGEAEDTVRIMSIHKSKGLEFPVVFVSGIAKQFNVSDARSKVVLHADLGIGCDYVDPEKRVKRPNLLKKVIQRQLSQESLGEELRVLYVAMTRAKEKLILTGAVSSLDQEAAACGSVCGRRREALPYLRLSSASCYLDWLLPALLRHPDASGFRGDAPAACSGDFPEGEAQGRGSEEARFRCIRAFPSGQMLRRLADENAEALRLRQLLEMDLSVCQDPEAAAYLDRVFCASYPWQGDQEICAKLSVSELKRMSRGEDEGEKLYEEEEVVPLIPSFRGNGETLAGAARGTAYHKFMQNFHFSGSEPVEIQLEELIKCGKMSREEGEAIQPDRIRWFLASDVGRRMARASGRGTLFREQPFVIGVGADQIRAGWNPRQMVLVQGIIDAFFYEEDQGIVLLDYKTDYVRSAPELAEKYRPQLAYYAMALEKVTGCKVKRTVIYSFCLGREIVL